MLLALLCFGLAVAASAEECNSRDGRVCIQVYNKCPFPTWIGILGPGNPEGGGFFLDGGQTRNVHVPERWTAGRIWARTGCDGNFDCETGFCGNKEQCNGAGGRPPVSLAEFTLGAAGAGNQDFYDVSMVDGYNLPVLIDPVEGTFNSNGGQYDCKRAGGCFKNVNEMCPGELQVHGRSGNVVACMTPCTKWRDDHYCCHGAFNTPDKCHADQWPVPWYYHLFKDACPGAYAYAYDDKTSTFTCRGKGSISPVYRVQFC